MVMHPIFKPFGKTVFGHTHRGHTVLPKNDAPYEKNARETFTAKLNADFKTNRIIQYSSDITEFFTNIYLYRLSLPLKRQ